MLHKLPENFNRMEIVTGLCHTEVYELAWRSRDLGSINSWCEEMNACSQKLAVNKITSHKGINL